MRLLNQNWRLDDTSENDERWFLPLSDGDRLGYDLDTEEFSYKNYWNTIDDDEAEYLIKLRGVDY